MNWEHLHHPDISLPVIKRKAGRELITLLSGTAELLLSGGRSTLYAKQYPNDSAYRSSVDRLRKQGLITVLKTDASMPTLKLTHAALNSLPDYYTPEKFWNKRWCKRWYILMFDVPEKDRAYRDTLRKFLRKLRCGCLQKSVWVTPVDIRPDYDDLNRAAAVESVAFLFESRTVLGFGDQSVVQEAWNFEKLRQIQDLYIRTAEKNLNRLREITPTEKEIMQLLQTDNIAYSQAMCLDPLLPRELHPKGYIGETVFKTHTSLYRQAIKQAP